MARPHLTLLLVTQDGFARADFSAGEAAPIGWWRRKTEPGDDPWVIDAALELAPPARRTWVLADAAWTQTVSVPAGATGGLTPADLAQVLAFEIEPLSGVAAADSALSSVPLPGAAGQARFWVCQVTQTTLARCDQSLRRYGGRLAGILHPGGVGRPLHLPATTPWQRIELWPDAVVCVHGEPGRAAEVFVINTDPRAERWADDVAEWKRGRTAAQTETRLLDGMIVTAPDEDSEGIEDEEPSLRLLLTAWGQVLRERRPPAVPAVRPAPRSMAHVGRAIASVCLFVVALAACLADRANVSRDLPALTAEASDLKARGDQLQSIKAQRKRLEAEQKEVAKQTEPLAVRLQLAEGKLREVDARLQHRAEALATHRKRVAEFLGIVADARPADLIIRKIEADTNEPLIRGLCLSPQGANKFAAALDERLRPLSWRVPPPKLEAQGKLDDGGPWAFELRIEDITPHPPQPANRTAAPNGAGDN